MSKLRSVPCVCEECGACGMDGGFKAGCAGCLINLRGLRNRARHAGRRHVVKNLDEIEAKLSQGEDSHAVFYKPAPELCSDCIEVIDQFNRQHAGKFSAKLITVALADWYDQHAVRHAPTEGDGAA